MIEIVAQPSNRQALIDTNTTFTVDVSLTDSSYTTELSYQWALQGEDIDDGTVTTEISATNVDITYTSDDAIDLPSDATDVVITVAGGKGGEVDLIQVVQVDLVVMEELRSLPILMVLELLR